MNTRLQCYHKCMESLYYESYQCLPNAYISEKFIHMNASQIVYRICDNRSQEYSVDENECKERCIRSCRQTYYRLSLEGKSYLGPESVTKIRITYEKSQE